MLGLAPSPRMLPMPLDIIVSYDGTTHDDDALTLGRMLAANGASLSLAYVRHSREYDPRREEIAAHDAMRRLEQGAMWLVGEPPTRHGDEPPTRHGNEPPTRHVVVNPSTSAGLADLAASEGADLIVFGSDYRTPPGRVEPGSSAQGLLDNGSVAVAVAAAGLRTAPGSAIKTVSVSGELDGAAAATARGMVASLGAQLIEGQLDADLILVDSRASAPEGRMGLDGSARAQLESARGSVLVLPRGVALRF
jgi:nucleotide-binding universal stress UspA family protein